MTDPRADTIRALRTRAQNCREVSFKTDFYALPPVVQDALWGIASELERAADMADGLLADAAEQRSRAAAAEYKLARGWDAVVAADKARAIKAEIKLEESAALLAEGREIVIALQARVAALEADLQKARDVIYYNSGRSWP